MADGKINSEIGWQTLTHTWAKVIPQHLSNTGRVRKSIRDLKRKQR